MKKYLIIVISILSIFITWLLFSLYIDNQIMLPNPIIVFKRVIELLTDYNSLYIIYKSLSRLIISLMIAFLFGLTFGILGGLFKYFDAFLLPIVTSLRTLPVVSIIIIILIWVGYESAPYLITFLMIFPVIYQSIVTGINEIDDSYNDVLKIYSTISLRTIFKVHIPLISPYIYTSLIQSLGLGLKVLVMAEMLSQTRNSIGYVIYLEKLNLNIDILFAWTIILIIIVSIIEVFVRKINCIFK